jgi:ABC-type multidrug transport system ATPase subunit
MALQVSGSVKYNGHTLDEFVPQKTSAYISQHDLHVGEMTVRETLDFSARCQGVGTRYGRPPNPNNPCSLWLELLSLVLFSNKEGKVLIYI